MGGKDELGYFGFCDCRGADRQCRRPVDVISLVISLGNDRYQPTDQLILIVSTV